MVKIEQQTEYVLINVILIFMQINWLDYVQM